ncbi:MAG: single-stranded DNA-binding protein [Candidatus Altiarchaeota archaeon]|nr:single-stranded DNA-binding protein [Candidatus Altiarchaeota archaeon]
MLNRVMLIGRLGNDPEVRHTQDGVPVATFNLATDEQWKDKKGGKVQKTEWHRIVAWRKLGEICGEYLAKGKSVFIEGKIQSRSWEDDDGNKRQVTEIIAQGMRILGGSPGNGGQNAKPEPSNGPFMPDDDIPF